MPLDENLIAELSDAGVIFDTLRRLPPHKKERIYRTAIELFGEYGYDGLSIDRLCAQASISKGSFFQYFPSKSHLLEFAVLVFDNYLESVVNELRQNETAVLARDRLRYLYQALVVDSRLFAAEEKFYLFVTRAVDHSAIALKGLDLERHFYSYVTDIIDRGVQTGEIRSDFDVALTGQLCCLVVGALVTRHYAGDRRPHRHMEEYLVSFLFDGIKA